MTDIKKRIPTLEEYLEQQNANKSEIAVSNSGTDNTETSDTSNQPKVDEAKLIIVSLHKSEVDELLKNGSIISGGFKIRLLD